MSSVTTSKDLEYQLHMGCRYGGDTEVLDLLQRGVDPNSHLAPLHRASYHNYPLCAQYLVKFGASLSMTTGPGWTALHWACYDNRMDCAKMLLDHHSPTDIKDNRGRTAVDLAREEGNNDVAEFVAGYKSLPREPLSSYPSFKQLSQLQVDQYSQLALHFGLTEDQMKELSKQENPTAATLFAAKVNDIDLQWKQIVEALLAIGEYKLAERVCSEQGNNALFVSAFYNWTSFIKYLTDTGVLAPREPVNEAGDTVLSIACTRGHIGVIDYFIKDKDCDPDGPVNAAGDTLRSLAESYGLSEVIKYLDDLEAGSSDPGEQQKYMRILDEMMRDTKNSILLHYQKVHFIGGSGTGKSTTRNRLIGEIVNLASLPEEGRKRRSTNLAEFTQVMAVMDESESKLTLKVAGDHDDETRMLFAYVHSNKSINTDSTPPVQVSPKLSDQNSVDGGNPNIESSISSIDIPGTTVAAETTAIPTKGMEDSSNDDQLRLTVVDVDKVLARLRSIVGSGKYTEQLQNKVLLNLIDVGGQPGFLEMLPFLSKGPGMFLAFFRLDKDLDELCEVSFERDEDKITPYKAIYTIRETLSQILSAINHHVTYDQTMDEEHLSKLGDLASMKPVATLVGTFKDKLETKVTREVLEAKLSTEFPKAAEHEKKKVINLVLTGSIKGHNPTIQANTDMQSAVNQLLTDSESFQREVRNRLDQKLAAKNETIATITCHFGSLLFPPADDQQFISLDNFNGEEADIDPLREHLQDMFETFFKDAKLRIRPSQLLLGVILRKEYDIVSMDDCIRIGRALSMGEEEVRFSVWYLDRWVGALIYHPEIEDEDDWFKKNIICSPQVVFDSISSLIVESLLELHCPKGKSRRLRFLPDEKKNWAEKGQFSLNTVKRCLSKENKKLMKEGKLIPVEKLVKFLEHSNLLSLITTKKQQGRQVKEEIMCFIPAILECASLEELTNSSSTDIDTPSPIKITFESGYVPVGVFCAMISQLISRGKKGVLGMRWELVESGVKRNLVSFHVDNTDNIVTLVAHVDCYEIRVIKQGSCLHDFRSYVLSTVLFVIKEISNFCRPIIAFDCKCGHHQSKTSNRLCRLSTGVSTSITCENGHVTLNASQESWFAKEVKLGDSVSLSVFPYAEVGSTPGLTFKWIKNGSYKGDQAVLRLGNIGCDSCTGYYSCRILRNGELYFNMYYCLRITSDVNPCKPNTDTTSQDCLSVDQHLKVVRADMWDLRPQWWDLGVELDITQSTLEEIRSNHNGIVQNCFTVMLECWLAQSPTWATLIEALRSCVIEREDIAQKIEARSKGQGSTTSAGDYLNVDKHLKVVRKATWELRAAWYDLGVELDVTATKLQMIRLLSDFEFQEIQNDHHSTNACFTALLTHWLKQTSVPPTWTALLEAMRSPPVGRDDVADQIETMLANKK